MVKRKRKKAKLIKNNVVEHQIFVKKIMKYVKPSG